MNKDEFWRLIEESGAGGASDADCTAQAERLTRTLAEQSLAEIFAFNRLLSEYLQSSYRNGLWEISSIVNRDDGSEDGFEYFRGWLIAQGRTYFEQAVANPERAADRAEPADPAYCEAMLYVAREAYQVRTGQEAPEGMIYFDPSPEEITEPYQPWPDDETLALRYPALWNKFATKENAL